MPSRISSNLKYLVAFFVAQFFLCAYAATSDREIFLGRVVSSEISRGVDCPEGDISWVVMVRVYQGSGAPIKGVSGVRKILQCVHSSAKPFSSGLFGGEKLRLFFVGKEKASEGVGVVSLPVFEGRNGELLVCPVVDKTFLQAIGGAERKKIWVKTKVRMGELGVGEKVLLLGSGCFAESNGRLYRSEGILVADILRED